MLKNQLNRKVTNNFTLPKYKLKLKFFFITNFRPSFKFKKNSRFHFCKNFFLFIFFLLYYLNLKIKKLKYFSNQIKPHKPLVNLNYNPVQQISNNKFNFSLNQSFKQLTKIDFFFKKKINFLNFYKNFSIFFLSYEKKFFNIKTQHKFLFNFLIFTKFFSHFIILRAPFRDKISKNTFQNQRFYIYLSIYLLKINFFLFFTKIQFYYFLKQFQNRLIFNSNIVFLHSKKIEFYFIFFNFFF